MKSILVVIPTLNEAANIDRVIKSLSSHSDQREVIYVVVDGGSTDGTCEKVDAMRRDLPNLHLLRNPRRVQSAAINGAVKQFGDFADVLVRCDAHAVYPPDFVEQAAASLKTLGADSIVIPMDSIGDTCFRRAVAWVSDTALGSGGSAHRGGRSSGWVDHGHHAAFRMDSFQKAGGYDESFSHNEDAELDCRLTKRGGRIYLDSDLRIGYYPRPTLKKLAQQYFCYGKGRSRTVRKHPSSLRFRQLVVPVHMTACALALVLAPWWPALMLWPALYLAAVATVNAGLLIKHRSVCALPCGVAALAMHVAWTAGFVHGMVTLRQPRWRDDRPPRPPVPGVGALGGRS